MSNYNREHFIRKNQLVFIDEYLLKIDGNFSIDKNGVFINLDGTKHFFQFDQVANYMPFKFQNGLWDKIKYINEQSNLNVYLRVDLSSPVTYPGMRKFSALMFGVQVSAELLENCTHKYQFVHYDENHQGLSEKATMAWFYRESDNKVVVFIEKLPSPDENNYSTWSIHSEYDKNKKVFTHCDGAFKQYSPESFLIRYHATPIRAEHADDYQKVFRVDGDLEVIRWVNLVSAFFPNERLIKEMFEKFELEDENLSDEQ